MLLCLGAHGQLLQLRWAQVLVAHPLAGQGTIVGGLATLSHKLAAVAAGRLQHQLGRQGSHLHLHVQAVQQRAAQTGLVTRDMFRGATAGGLLSAQVAAGAGVHGGHPLKLRGQLGVVPPPGNQDATTFQGLAQGFQAVP